MPPVATTLLLNVAVPASLPSKVKKVVSELPSVPFKIISVSLPCASINLKIMLQNFLEFLTHLVMQLLDLFKMLKI